MHIFNVNVETIFLTNIAQADYIRLLPRFSPHKCQVCFVSNVGVAGMSSDTSLSKTI